MGGNAERSRWSRLLLRPPELLALGSDSTSIKGKPYLHLRGRCIVQVKTKSRTKDGGVY